VTHPTDTSALLTQPTLTIPEAAQVLGISRNSAYSAAHRGEIPSIQIGSRLVVPTARLKTLLGLDSEVRP